LYIVDRGAQASCAGVFLVETTQSEANRAGCYYVRDSAEGVSELLRQVKELPGEVVVISSISNLDRTVIERLLDWTSDSGIGLAAPALVSGQGSFLSVGMCEPRGEPEHNFNGVAADAMGYRGRLRVPFNVSSVAPGLFVVRRELLVSAPSDFVDIAELVYYLSSLAISRGKRVVVDPTLRVRIDPQLLGASIAGARARELRGLAGIERSGDPYFPRGLVSYLNCDRMPDS
jgi:hypothetical protein